MHVKHGGAIGHFLSITNVWNRDAAKSCTKDFLMLQFEIGPSKRTKITIQQSYTVMKGSSGVVRSRQGSSGLVRSRQESSGVVRSRQESSGVVRSRQESSGVVRSRQVSSGVVRSRPESSGVVRGRQESSGVVRSRQRSRSSESSGVVS